MHRPLEPASISLPLPKSPSQAPVYIHVCQPGEWLGTSWLGVLVCKVLFLEFGTASDHRCSGNMLELGDRADGLTQVCFGDVECHSCLTSSIFLLSKSFPSPGKTAVFNQLPEACMGHIYGYSPLGSAANVDLPEPVREDSV